MIFINRLLSAIITIAVIAGSALGSFSKITSSDFDYMLYPEEAITAFNNSILERISGGDDYVSNQGYDETGLYISPQWSLKINNKATPLYATAVYDWELDRGVVQSFQYIFINDDSFSLDIRLKFSGEIKSVSVLPEALGASAQVSGGVVSTVINKCGTYTYLINDDSQECAVTLFVCEQTDEDAQIHQYQKIYGKDNVDVYEKGFYCLDTLPVDKDVIYFKKGSFISANHINDIKSQEDEQNNTLSPFANIYAKENAIITGFGTIDFTKLDRKERNLINLYFCKNTTIEGLTILNPNSWTITAYASENCKINRVAIFGYRMNSDGINICGCANMKITNSFCRNGDDSFSVKTTNTEYECHDVEFSNCIAWSNKARCFGITGEVERDIYNVLFSDCAVIYRNATWDNDRIASLAIIVETGSGNIDNVVFDNIEIHHDSGRPISCIIYGEDISGCSIKNISFKNIKFSAKEKIKISSKRTMSGFGKFSSSLVRIFEKNNLDRFAPIQKTICCLKKCYDTTNKIEVNFENITSNGKKIKNQMIIHGNSAVETH